MDFKGCIKKGLIKRNKIVKNRIKKSLEISKKFLGSANKNFKIQEYETSVMVAYNSIFHSCRALLFNKEYSEKSHFCLSLALKSLYKKDKKLMRSLRAIDKIRLSRHEIQYRGEIANKGEAKFVLDVAKNLLYYTKKLLI